MATNPQSPSILLEIDSSEPRGKHQSPYQRLTSRGPTLTRSTKLLILVVLIIIMGIALTVFLVLFARSEDDSRTHSAVQSPPLSTPEQPVNQSFITSTSPPSEPPATAAPTSQPKYLFSTFELSWFDALARCRTHGMELVSIETQAEQDWILTYLKQIGYVRATNSWWTSGNSLDSMNVGDSPPTFIWAATNEPMHFTFWHHGEPNKADSQKCLEITDFTGAGDIPTDGQTRWNSWICAETVKFICERGGGGPEEGFARI